MSISVITPSGGRQKGISLLQNYLDRQDYKGKIDWIVIDDVVPRQEMRHQKNNNISVRIIHSENVWKEGQVTLSVNLALGLELAAHDKILIMEDDDWYCPQYISRMSELLDEYDLVGEKFAKYYNVRDRRYEVMNNGKHASLCQTGFTKSIFSSIIEQCDTKNKFLDIGIWKFIKCNKFLFQNENLCIGIKGMAGREGIGTGHRDHPKWNHDMNLETLKEWIGEDYQNYGDEYDLEL